MVCWGKAVSANIMEAYGRGRYNATNSKPWHEMGVSGQLHGQSALYPGTAVLVPTEYKVGWVPQTVWMFWIRNNSTAPAVKFPRCPVTIPPMLSQLPIGCEGNMPLELSCFL
jgi:hypothetical protein